MKGKTAPAAVAAEDSTCKKRVVEAKIVAAPKATTAAAPKAKGTTAVTNVGQPKAPNAKAVEAKANTPAGKKAPEGRETPPAKKTKTDRPVHTGHA